MSAISRTAIAAAALAALATVAACSPANSGAGNAGGSPGRGAGSSGNPAGVGISRTSQTSQSSQASQRFTMNFAGDVHFMGRTAARLAANPATVFGQAASALGAADVTMLNLETAITTRGTAQAKQYRFRTAPVALTALADAGVDVVTMANNHAADYGTTGLRDTVAAIKASGLPVVGIGADAKAAFAPYKTTVNGTKLAIFGADAVNDETTLRLFSAGAGKAGVANGNDRRLLAKVKAAKRAGYTVIVYMHWGVEKTTCPDAAQQALAGKLANAGAAAIIGSHPHLLQGSGWRGDGVFVDYSMGNYLWWDDADIPAEYDTAVLTLSFEHGKVTGAKLTPARIDSRGVPVPATGAAKARIQASIAAANACDGGLLSTPPR